MLSPKTISLVAVLGVVIGLLIVLRPDRPILQALTPTPEPFTELYFEDHLQLPRNIVAGSVTQIAFTVNNLEYKPVEYPIVVVAEDATDSAEPKELYQTTIHLQHNQSKTIPLDLVVPAFLSNRTKVTIRLVTIDQSIHFWTTLSPAPATKSAKITRSN